MFLPNMEATPAFFNCLTLLLIVGWYDYFKCAVSEQQLFGIHIISIKRAHIALLLSFHYVYFTR